MTGKSDDRNKDWYVAVLDAIDDMILVKGDRSKLLWANRSFLTYYGMTNEELQQIIDAPHSDPDDTLQYVRDDHLVFTSGETLDIPAEPVTDSQGKTEYFHTVKTPIQNDRGEVIRTVGVSRRVRSDEAVTQSQQRRVEQKSSLAELRTLVSSIPLAVAMLDIKQRFLCHSTAWQELLNYNGPPLLGEFFDTTFQATVPLADAIDAAVTKVCPQRIDALEVMTGSTSTTQILDVDVHPWFLPSGEVGGSIVMIRDVTEAKASEHKLQQLNEELTQFNYRVSHDLVAPLRTIRGYLNICKDEISTNPELVTSLHDKMIANVDHLSQLVQDVLNLARSDVATEDETAINLHGLVEEVLHVHQEAIEEANIDTRIDLTCHEVRSSRFRIRQILQNFVSNAIKYHDPAKSKKHLSITSVINERGFVLTVADNGLGVADELGESVFDIFVRGSSKHSGNGLGLYLVKKHAEMLGGTVGLPSRRDDTVFQICLPNGQAA